MKNINVHTRVNGAVDISVACGDGSQSILWLALTVADRYQKMQASHGRMRQRESIVKASGRFVPACVEIDQVPIRPKTKIYRVLNSMRKGNLVKHSLQLDLEPDEQSDTDFSDKEEMDGRRSYVSKPSRKEKKQESKSESRKPKLSFEKVVESTIFHVTLATTLQCRANEAPGMVGVDSSWHDVAFGHSDASRARIEHIREQKLALRNEEKEKLNIERVKESMAHFLFAIGRDDIVHRCEELSIEKWDGEILFYTEQDELGDCAVADWKGIQASVDAFLHHESSEVIQIKRSIFHHFRLLRDAFKMYSGLGSDNFDSMKFSELMYLLQDAGICEMKDSDIITRLINFITADSDTKRSRADTFDSTEGMGSHSDLSLSRAQFLECLVRILLSEDIYKVLHVRSGQYDPTTGMSLPRPAARFKEIMDSCVVPNLERKLFNSLVRQSLSNIEVLKLFAKKFHILHSIFSSAAVLFPPKDNPSSRLRLRRNSLDKTAQSPPRHQHGGAHGLNVREFTLLLRKAGLVELSSNERDVEMTRDQLRYMGSSSFFHSSAALLEEKNTAGEGTKLTYSDAKSLFSVALFEKDFTFLGGTAPDELSFKEFVESIVRLSMILKEEKTDPLESIEATLKLIINTCKQTHK